MLLFHLDLCEANKFLQQMERKIASSEKNMWPCPRHKLGRPGDLESILWVWVYITQFNYNIYCSNVDVISVDDALTVVVDNWMLIMMTTIIIIMIMMMMIIIDYDDDNDDDIYPPDPLPW